MRLVLYRIVVIAEDILPLIWPRLFQTEEIYYW